MDDTHISRESTARTNRERGGEHNGRTTTNGGAEKRPGRVLSDERVAEIAAKQGTRDGVLADLLATIRALQGKLRQYRAAREREPGRRVPPQALESEAAAIACVLLDPARLDDVRAALTAEDFYGEANATIYRAMCSIADGGAVPEMALLYAQLKRDGHYKDVGGAAYLADVVATECLACNALHHAEIVADAARRRAIIRRAEQDIEAAYGEADP